MKTLLGLLACIVLAASCSNEDLNSSDFEAGELFTDSNIRVVQLDTMTTILSTMKFDSIITSQSSRMLIGKYSDPVFGNVKSSSYVEMLPDSYSIDTDAIYDSIVFIIRYDNYYYNDTLLENTIHIKEVNEKLEPADDTNFYNSSSIAYEDEDVGAITYTPRPFETDSLLIKLSDSLGLDLFENLQGKNLTNYDEFINHFKGLTFRPDELNNSSIIGFSLASEMRIYYSIEEDAETEQYFTQFTINTSSVPTPFFNQIIAEEPNEYLNGLTDIETVLNSEDAENQSFVQSGIGITTRIEFPHIKSVYDIQGQGTLLDATLRIKPKEASYNDELILRDTLAVYVVDQNNVLTSATTMTAILNRDNQEFNDIYYELQLSSYLEALLVTEKESTDALILLPNDYTSTVDRFILDVDYSNKGTQLELTYAIYDENE
ncbi:DUF4270 family protein [Aurantibacter sp.]|uniref:DUF4270 family protein n=1 Tax=Aurantibacter sp. TaxID=2807103 RepID=UPI0032651DF7